MNSQVESRPGSWSTDHPLRRLGTRLVPGAGGFLSWWGRNLAAWLPQRARQALGMDRGRLLLQVQGESLTLRLQRGAELRDLGVLPGLADASGPDLAALAAPGAAARPADPLAPLLSPGLADLPRWLLLPAASSLRRRLQLPAAAAERLRDVVGFEIDRQTPFAADAVAFDARVLGKRESDGQIDAELVAVPRQALNPQLAAVGPLADTLAGVDVAGADGAPLGVNLLAPAQRRRHSDPFRTWNLALAAIALIGVAATLWQLLENRRAAADQLQQTISSHAQEAREVAAQRQELVGLIEGQAFLDRTRAERPSTVELIDELSKRLPDSTYLEKLAIEDNSLLVMGLSREASSLIARMQGTPLWRTPALTGAVQPDPTTGRDRFTLTAEIGPPRTEAARGQ